MTTNPKLIRRAYYSPAAAKTHGSFFYRSLDGKEVEVTFVSEGLDEEPYYDWSDKIYVGLVAEFIRRGRLGCLDLLFKRRNFLR